MTVPETAAAPHAGAPLPAAAIDALLGPEFRSFAIPTLPPHLGDGPVTVGAVRSLDDRLASFTVSDEARAVEVVGDAGKVVVVRIHGRLPAPAGILWIHGGGMFMGAAEREDVNCAGLASDLSVPVVAVDYRLAPEHPHPAPLDDCLAAVRWMAARVDRLVVAGASAGGGLAAAVALRARDEGGPELAGVHAYYPMLDDRSIAPSVTRLANAPVWNRRLHDLAWAAYVAGPADAYAAPARAERLDGLPPHYLDVGTVDLFVDEVIDYAHRLESAGVAVELDVEPGAPHAFDLVAPAARGSVQAGIRRRRSLARMLRQES